MKFGYARVSTQDQNLDLQIDELLKVGVEEENIFKEKITGTKKDRPEFQELLKRLREGDAIVVWKLDRIGRSTKHLVDLMNYFNEHNINFISIKENIDTSTAMGKFIFTIFAALAEFERDMISERTKAGLSSARSRGRKGGRPAKNQKSIDRALQLYDSKSWAISEIEKMTNVSKATLYRYLRDRSNQS